MAGSDARIPGWAAAPFGRIGHRLGWRWIFFFTFPIPFHPLLYRAIPLAVLGWLVWLAVGGGEVDWYSPLILAAILAVPLSVPFLQWILFAFRIHLIQALMLPAALLLLAVAIARGEEPPWLLAPLLLFLAAYTAAAIASRRHFAAWEADNRRVEALASDSGPLPPLLLRGSGRQDIAARLLDALSLPAIHAEDASDSWLLQRTDDAELIEWLSEVRDMRLHIFQLRHGKDHRVVAIPGERPTDALVVEQAAAPPSGFRRGQVAGVRVAPPGLAPLTYWYGSPAPLSWIPGFYFLIALQLGSRAGFVPQIGFLPGRSRKLGKRSGEEGAHLALASALRLQGPSPAPFADPVDLRRRITERLDARLEPELSALDRLIASPATWMERKLDTLLRLPRLYARRAEDLVEALRAARDTQHEAATILLARLIAALPEDAFQRVGDALLAVVNSKRLAGRVKTEGAAGEPPHMEGLRLLIHVPQLYVRLGDLGERARGVIEGLLTLLPHIEALQQAKAKLDEAADKPSDS